MHYQIGAASIPFLRALFFYIVGSVACVMSGCLSPIAMHQAVLSYDATVTQVSSERLLLNIVRARFNRPVHFTTVSSVAARFDFRVSAGITPPEGDVRGLVGPVFNTTVAENPTVTIIPMDGAQFEQRLLTPLDESRFLALLELGGDLGMALRMMGAAMHLGHETAYTTLKNEPGGREEYEAYRRRALHLSTLYRNHQLFIEPVLVGQIWAGPMERAPEPDGILRALDKGYSWSKVGGNRYALSRSRVLLANYHPSLLKEGESKAFSNLLDWPPNEILIDIRPGSPVEEFPFQGRVSLRSFNSVLQFLARGMEEQPEYAVDQDPRTGPVEVNPPQTLQVAETDAPPPYAAFVVEYNGRYYSVQEERGAKGEGANWNMKAFSMLYQLF